MGNDNIIIVDYGMGNLASIKNMFKHIGIESSISSIPNEIEKASKLILPGVGAFDNGMHSIHQLGLYEILNKKVIEAKTPILGICLGMQLLTKRSDEGQLPGLGWIDAETIKFSSNKQDHRIPHMGWNKINILNNNSILKGFDEIPKFYFVHSYYVKCNKKKNVLGNTEYGNTFDSVIENENIFGCQFHPEKSHKFGMKILENFYKL